MSDEQDPISGQEPQLPSDQTTGLEPIIGGEQNVALQQVMQLAVSGKDIDARIGAITFVADVASTLPKKDTFVEFLLTLTADDNETISRHAAQMISKPMGRTDIEAMFERFKNNIDPILNSNSWPSQELPRLGDLDAMDNLSFRVFMNITVRFDPIYALYLLSQHQPISDRVMEVYQALLQSSRVAASKGELPGDSEKAKKPRVIDIYHRLVEAGFADFAPVILSYITTKPDGLFPTYTLNILYQLAGNPDVNESSGVPSHSHRLTAEFFEALFSLTNHLLEYPRQHVRDSPQHRDSLVRIFALLEWFSRTDTLAALTEPAQEALLNAYNASSRVKNQIQTIITNLSHQGRVTSDFVTKIIENAIGEIPPPASARLDSPKLQLLACLSETDLQQIGVSGFAQLLSPVLLTAENVARTDNVNHRKTVLEFLSQLDQNGKFHSPASKSQYSRLLCLVATTESDPNLQIKIMSMLNHLTTSDIAAAQFSGGFAQVLGAIINNPQASEMVQLEALKLLHKKTSTSQ